MVDSSDVVVQVGLLPLEWPGDHSFPFFFFFFRYQVLDCRNPMGTRSKMVESFIRKEKSHKHLVFLLNKCDLVPTWVTVSLFLQVTPPVVVAILQY